VSADSARAALVERLRSLAASLPTPPEPITAALNDAADRIEHDGAEMRYLITGEEADA
jgi:hypothetical protein